MTALVENLVEARLHRRGGLLLHVLREYCLRSLRVNRQGSGVVPSTAAAIACFPGEMKKTRGLTVDCYVGLANS